MQQWEYAAFETDIAWGGSRDFSILWRRKNSDGASSFDSFQKLGEEGWELVSCVLVGTSLGWVFKRPKQ